MEKRKTFSTGFSKSRLHSYSQLMKYSHNVADLATHDYKHVFMGAKAVYEKYFELPIDQARMLDVGCGQRFPVTLMFHSLGAKITGIDTDVVQPHLTVRMVRDMLKHNGLERCIKTLARRLMYDPKYYKTIGKQAGVPLRFKEIDIRRMSAYDLEFPDCHFDYAYSNAVFEHIDQPQSAVREINRVLKPGGIANIGIHLFASVSGGHCLEWSNPDEFPSAKVPPWDHLRQNMYPTHVYLNKWRETDYLNVFEEYFTVLEHRCRHEGKTLLTEEILKELPGYSEDELLKRSIRLILRKQ